MRNNFSISIRTSLIGTPWQLGNVMESHGKLPRKITNKNEIIEDLEIDMVTHHTSRYETITLADVKVHR